MSIWAAIARGGFASASLYLGQALTAPLGKNYRVIGLVAGALTGAQ